MVSLRNESITLIENTWIPCNKQVMNVPLLLGCVYVDYCLVLSKAYLQSQSLSISSQTLLGYSVITLSIAFPNIFNRGQELIVSGNLFWVASHCTCFSLQCTVMACRVVPGKRGEIVCQRSSTQITICHPLAHIILQTKKKHQKELHPKIHRSSGCLVKRNP